MKLKIKLEGVVIVALVGLIGYQSTSMYKMSKTQREIESNRNNLEISQEDFHRMPNLLTIIPENKDIPSFVVRGDNMNKQIAFNDYKNNNIYTFDGYSITGASKDLIVNDCKVFIINMSTSTIDVICIDSFKPSIINSIEIENIEQFIGQDESNGLIFIKTTENDIVSYNYKKEQVSYQNIEGNRFSEIYNQINKTGDVLDCFFVNDIELPNKEKTNGIRISYIEDSKIKELICRYYPEKNSFKDIKVNVIKE